MKLVVIESPYAGDIERNVKYARACVSDSLHRGEAPIASHLLHTQPGILRDEIPGERALGIAAGHAWINSADILAVYCDLGVSKGMAAGVVEAQECDAKIEIQMRFIGPEKLKELGIFL